LNVHTRTRIDSETSSSNSLHPEIEAGNDQEAVVVAKKKVEQMEREQDESWRRQGERPCTSFKLLGISRIDGHETTAVTKRKNNFSLVISQPMNQRPHQSGGV